MTRKIKRLIKKIFLLLILVFLFCYSSLELKAKNQNLEELEINLAYARSIIIEFPERIDKNYYVSKPNLVEVFVLSKPLDYAKKNILVICSKAVDEDLEIFVDFPSEKSYLLKIKLTKELQSEDISFTETRSFEIFEEINIKEKSLIPVKSRSAFWDQILCSNPDLLELERVYDLYDENFFRSLILKTQKIRAKNCGDLIIPTENSIYKIPFNLISDNKNEKKDDYEITEFIYLD